LHVAERQETAEPAYEAHVAVELPSHSAEAQTLEASLAHTARVPWGLPLIGMHLPGRPVVESGTSHASHWPLHALSQQTPSAQWFEPHSTSAVHDAPMVLVHVPS
jgi:hypothetical protein